MSFIAALMLISSINPMQLQSVTTNNVLRELLAMDKFTFILECGFLKPCTTVVTEDVPDILHTVFAKYVFLCAAQEIAQFAEGLETLGIATLIKTQRRALKELFVYNPSIKVTADYLSRLLHFCHHVGATRGSRKRQFHSIGTITSRIVKVQCGTYNN